MLSPASVSSALALDASSEASVLQVSSLLGKTSSSPGEPHDLFLPRSPASLRETGLTASEVEALILKLLLVLGDRVGHDIADHIRLPFVLVEPLLRQMKTDRLVVYRSAVLMNDYMYQLTDAGHERAQQHMHQGSYCGSAPVRFEEYVASVQAQSLSRVPPNKKDLERAFADLLISPKMFARLGPALSAGRGMFLYGSPGNGKTSIAERLSRAYSEHIWIPRALGLDGEIMRVFDPMVHHEAPLPPPSSALDRPALDRRWVRIRRPTIVVGGELTMESLEVSFNPASGVCEAPVQVKSNCGTLVIDDLGRQRITVEQLMNRWIVPLERRQDFLNLPNGKKIQVPFEQLVVFSTNLEPKDLVDESFLRRIPYKIEIGDPDEAEFRALLRKMCVSLDIEYQQEAIEHLIREHYQATGRAYRFCHARDLLLQVRHYCTYHELPLRVAPELFDFAVDTYFSVT